MIDLNNIAREAYEVAEKREENGANIKTDTFSMLKHCSTEVVEATESFVAYRDIKNLAEDLTATDIDIRWESQEEPDVCEEYYQESRKRFYSELADIITCVLIIAGDNGIDIEQALKEVQEKNKARAEGRGDKK